MHRSTCDGGGVVRQFEVTFWCTDNEKEGIGGQVQISERLQEISLVQQRRSWKGEDATLSEHTGELSARHFTHRKVVSRPSTYVVVDVTPSATITRTPGARGASI